MKQFWIIAISCLIFGKLSDGNVDVNLSLPEGFIIGAGGSAYQMEGAWNVSDKTESIWDRWTHSNPNAIEDGSNGDIACNLYYKYKEDVQRIKAIGLDFYRFSISWPRVLPNGFSNVINENGLQYYKNLTAELLANGIQPVTTLYHWDHPQFLEEFGGWTNDMMIDLFVSFARIVFEALGDSVKIWTTFNEPNLFCKGSYELGMIAPGKNLSGIGMYRCMHNILKAHAKVYRMYDKEFRITQKGEIGIVLHCPSYIATNSSDTTSVETAFQFDCGWVTHPIYKGDYPEIMKERIAMISKAQGYEKSRLPEFSEEWQSFIKGTNDYYGLNHYTAKLVSPDPDEEQGIYNSDKGLIESFDPSWPKTAMSTMRVSPEGLYNILCKIKDEYDNPLVRVMENGYPGYDTLDDYDRIAYHRDYLIEMLRAVKQKGCNVKSYGIWSMVDDFEWDGGYVPKFGMYSVDFNDTDRPRTARLSASWWQDVLKERAIQPVPTNELL